MCMEYDHDHAKLASETGKKQISRVGESKSTKMFTAGFCMDCSQLFFLLYWIFSVLLNGQASFFLMYNICSRFLKSTSSSKSFSCSCQAMFCTQAHSPDVSTCLPSLSGLSAHKFHVWGFSAHTHNISHWSQLAPSLVGVISTQPTHRAQRVWLL